MLAFLQSGRNPELQWSHTIVPLPVTQLFWPDLSVGVYSDIFSNITFNEKRLDGSIRILEWPTLCIGAMDYQWLGMTFSPTNYSTIGRYSFNSLYTLNVIGWMYNSSH